MRSVSSDVLPKHTVKEAYVKLSHAETGQTGAAKRKRWYRKFGYT